MKKIIYIFSLFIAVIGLLDSCINLESESYDSINTTIFPTMQMMQMHWLLQQLTVRSVQMDMADYFNALKVVWPPIQICLPTYWIVNGEIHGGRLYYS